MTDYTREDIELMALAAGYEVTWWNSSFESMANGDEPDEANVDDETWCPWESKAQCFDLMVDAGINLYMGDRSCISSYDDSDAIPCRFRHYKTRESCALDAVCRAAIEKGRAMRGDQ